MTLRYDNNIRLGNGDDDMRSNLYNVARFADYGLRDFGEELFTRDEAGAIVIVIVPTARVMAHCRDSLW